MNGSDRPIRVGALLLLGAAFLAAGVWVAPAILAADGRAARPAAGKAPNPHWKKETCNACHTMNGAVAAPIDPEAIDALCINCHDGHRAAAEYHPVGRTFDNKLYTRPANWPLTGGRLVCITCHDVRKACDHPGQRTRATAMFLRGQDISGRSQPFCANCHHEAAYKKLNPHVMVLPDGQDIVEEKCLFCHNRVPDRAAMARGNRPDLKGDEITLCRNCHPTHKDTSTRNHIGATLKPEMLAYMFAREKVGLHGKVNPETVAQVKAAGGRPSLMAVGKGEQILCTTCHNPHQIRVFAPGSVLGYRAMRLDKDGRTVSPVRDETWCRHCHEL